MKRQKAIQSSAAARVSKTKYAWAAQVVLIVALLMGFFAAAPRVAAKELSFQRSVDAETSRWVAKTSYYTSQALAKDPELVYARAFGLEGSSVSVALPLTDVSHFYAERMRALAHAESVLASSPELLSSRAFYSAAAILPLTDVSHFYVERMRAQALAESVLASSPELLSSRAFGSAARSAAGLACSLPGADSRFGTDPELVYSTTSKTC